MSYQRWNGDKQMQENMKEYLTEKEAKEKRLEVYTEKIQEKVLSRSSETIRQFFIYQMILL